MKNGLKLVLVAFLTIVGSAAMAQQVKLGYINSQELFQAMPERDSAFTKLNAYAAELEGQLEMIQVELNNKLQDYQKNAATFTDAIRTMKEKELQDLNARLQQSNQIAQEDLENQQAVLLGPVFEKMNAAIEKTAQANSITAVFDVAAGAMIYHDKNAMVDMLPLVKRELGI